MFLPIFRYEYNNLKRDHKKETFLKSKLIVHFLEFKMNFSKLSFLNKMKLLPDNQAVSFVKPGIIKLNSLRNKVAHQLDIEFSNDDLGDIKSILKIAKMNVDESSFIENIEKFTSIACTWLTPKNEKIQKYIAESTSHLKLNQDL